MAIVDNFLLFSLIVSAGVFTQSAAGFAAGLVMIPLMGYAEFGIPEAQAVLLVATIPQNLLGLYQFRASIHVNEVVWPATLRFLAFPAGLATLCWVEALPPFRIKQILGAVILVCVALLCAVEPRDRQKMAGKWTLLAFLSSGFFAGLTGTGGPMMVLWVQAHRWSTERSRAFLFALYLVYSGPVLIALWWQFGDRVLGAIVSLILLLPILLLVSKLGLRFGTWLGRRRLRQITMALLTVIGLAGLLASPS